MMLHHFLKCLWQKKTIVKKSAFLHGMGLFALLLCFHTTTTYAFSWQDLWINPDHSAQKMMNKGQYAEAQKHFKREDWRATAAFRAGNYQEASALFSALNQADGYYNAGNAYAHQGEYEKALQAYDKALALNKQNQDAIANRQIVAELLKKQREQQQKSQNTQKQSKQNQDKQNQDKQGQGKQDQDKQNQDKQNQDKQDKGKQDQDKQNQDKQNQDEQDKGKQGQDKQNQDKQNQDKQEKGKQDQDKQNQDKQNQDKQEKGKQDQDKQNQDKQDQTGLSEQSKQAMEKHTMNQWLNMIPDDPGGLLREKFLRDYLRRRGES